MSSFSQFAIKLSSLAIIITVSKMMLPEGKMKKTVNVVFSLLIILVLVTPILNLKNVEIEKPQIDVSVIQTDEEFLIYVLNLRVEQLEKIGESALNETGIDKAKVTVFYENVDGKIIIKKVAVNLANAVISDENKHINITEKTKEKLSNVFQIQKEAVIIE